ncbi:hypothetical protein HDU93_009537, partial [Gonapodya sp. JEL0774]
QAVMEALKMSPPTSLPARAPGHGRSASRDVAAEVAEFVQGVMTSGEGIGMGSPGATTGEIGVPGMMGHGRSRSRDLGMDTFSFGPSDVASSGGSNGLSLHVSPGQGHARTRSRDLATDPFGAQGSPLVSPSHSRARSFGGEPFSIGRVGSGDFASLIDGHSQMRSPAMGHSRLRSRDMASEGFSALPQLGDEPVATIGHTRMRSRDVGAEVFGFDQSHRGSPLNSSADGPLLMTLGHARSSSRDIRFGSSTGHPTHMHVRNGSLGSSNSSGTEQIGEHQIVTGLADEQVRALFGSSPSLAAEMDSRAGAMLGAMGSRATTVDDVEIVRSRLVQLQLGVDQAAPVTRAGSGGSFGSDAGRLAAAAAEGMSKHAYDEDDAMFSAGVPKLDGTPERWKMNGSQAWVGLQ